MYEFKEQLGQYRIACRFDFSSYPQKDFEKDFKEFLAYQNLKTRTAEDNDLKVWHAQVGKIDFKEFKEKSFALFAKSLTYILRTNNELMTSREFNVVIHVKRAPDREWYIVYDPDSKKNTPKQANFDIAGIFLLNNIVAPALYQKKIDYSTVYRYIAQYLAIHKDKMKGNYRMEDKATEFAQAVAQKQESYNVKYLYETLNNLRDTGYPDFKTRIKNPVQEINAEGILLFNRNLVRLSRMFSDSKSKKFYEKNIGFQNLTSSGEVANGRHMCLTILLANAKKLGANITFQLGTGQANFKEITDFNSIFGRYTTIKFKDIPQQAIDATSGEISSTDSDRFLALYENACNILGIGEEYRVMTRSRYAHLYKSIQDKSRQNRWYNKIKWFGQ